MYKEYKLKTLNWEFKKYYPKSTKDLLVMLNEIDINFWSDLYDSLLQEILDHASEDELLELDKIEEKIYNRRVNISVKKYCWEKYIKNYYWYGWNYFFLEKDINKIKEQKKDTYKLKPTAAYFWYSSQWQFISVKEIDILDKKNNNIINYTGKLKIFSDNNILWFWILGLIDIFN